jgi:hypothetical protein
MHELITALDTDASAVAVNDSCVLHVHVGLQNDKAIPLRFLQTLAFLTIVYEDEIDRPHPLHRVVKNRCVASNRDDFREPFNRPWAGVVNDSGGRPLSPNLGRISKIRQLVFKTPSRQVLRDLLGSTRNKKINSTHIGGEDLLATVEVRHHAGCVEPVIIIHWARFCVALVR